MEKLKYLKIQVSENGVVFVTMDRAPANAVDQDMYRELYDVFSNIDQYAAKARVVVLSAAGRHFCAGNDLAEFSTMTSKNGTERMWRVRSAFFAIQECAVPVIGMVHGAALGTGIGIAASCDFLVAS